MLQMKWKFETNIKLKTKNLKERTWKIKIESNKGKLKVNKGHKLKESNKENALIFWKQ